MYFYLALAIEEEEEEYFIDQLRTNEGHSNYNDYIYIYIVCLFLQKKHTSVFLSWNFYTSVFYPKGKNTLVERIHSIS